MGRCNLVLFHRAKEANVPTLGPRFLVKFPRVGRAIQVKCPTYARGPPLPLGLNIDRCINTSINQLQLTLSTLHVEMCCWKHTISTVKAIHVESWNHEELRHVGLTPIVLCELMSREQVSQNYFATVKCILPWIKMILPW